MLEEVLKDMLSLKFNQVVKRITSNLNADKDPIHFDLINFSKVKHILLLQYFCIDWKLFNKIKNPHYNNKRV